MIRWFFKVLDIETQEPATELEFASESEAIEWCRSNPGDYIVELYRVWNSSNG